MDFSVQTFATLQYKTPHEGNRQWACCVNHRHRQQCGDGQREGGAGAAGGKGRGDGGICNSVNNKNKIKKLNGMKIKITHSKKYIYPILFILQKMQNNNLRRDLFIWWPHTQRIISVCPPDLGSTVP